MDPPLAAAVLRERSEGEAHLSLALVVYLQENARILTQYKRPASSFAALSKYERFDTVWCLFSNKYRVRTILHIATAPRILYTLRR